MDDHILGTLIDVPFTFSDRPTSLPGELRPVWRICFVVLLMEHCRGRRASLEQLHVMNWAVRSSEGRRILAEYLRRERGPDDAIVRYDPSLSRALDFALAEGLVTSSDPKKTTKPEEQVYRLFLTAKGIKLAHDLLNMDGVFETEKSFLTTTGKVTQTQVMGLFP